MAGSCMTTTTLIAAGREKSCFTRVSLNADYVSMKQVYSIQYIEPPNKGHFGSRHYIERLSFGGRLNNTTSGAVECPL